VTDPSVYRVADAGEFFATRESARRICQAATARSRRSVLTLDFEGVKAVTAAFADELITRLADHPWTTEGASAEVREVLDLAWERRCEETAP
jgi:hypothetical protein